MELHAFALHEYPKYLEACAKLMNEEWPRSLTARLHSLEKSCPSLPYNIVLVDMAASPPEVLGHSRITTVIGVNSACFVESVVVQKNRRGEGLGRSIMDHTEKLAKSLGYELMYLTTHDKQGFYSHIGYKYSQPVVTAGAASLLLQNNSRLLQNLEKQGKKCVVNEDSKSNKTSHPSQEQQTPHPTETACRDNHRTMHELNSNINNDVPASQTASSNCNPACDSSSMGDGGGEPQDSGAAKSPDHVPPPPPPPMPTSLVKKDNPAKDKSSITRMSPADISWMKKCL